VAKELWNYMLLRTNSTDVCIADSTYWNEVLDQDGNPNIRIISLIVCLVSFLSLSGGDRFLTFIPSFMNTAKRHLVANWTQQAMLL
jgi:hypothetical protein